MSFTAVSRLARNTTAPPQKWGGALRDDPINGREGDYCIQGGGFIVYVRQVKKKPALSNAGMTRFHYCLGLSLTNALLQGSFCVFQVLGPHMPRIGKLIDVI